MEILETYEKHCEYIRFTKNYSSKTLENGKRIVRIFTSFVQAHERKSFADWEVAFKNEEELLFGVTKNMRYHYKFESIRNYAMVTDALFWVAF